LYVKKNDKTFYENDKTLGDDEKIENDGLRNHLFQVKMEKVVVFIKSSQSKGLR